MGGQSRPPLRVQCKSPGECVGALCIIRQSIHLCYSVAAAPIGRAVLYRRRVVRCGEVTVVWWPERSILVLAVMLRQKAPRVSSASFCPIEPKCKPAQAFAFWRGRAAEWTRPAACGGARTMKLARTSRRRHSCGITAFYRMPVHANNPSVKTCGFATSPCTGEALGGQSRPPLNQSASPVRLHVVHPVIFAFTNCPISRSPPVMRTRRPPSVRAVSRSPSFPSTSTRIVLPTYAW